jgi:histone H3/H4
MAQMLVVVSKVKAMGKAVDFRISLEFCERLSEKLGDIVIAAVKIAHADGRGTVKARDMPIITLESKEE